MVYGNALTISFLTFIHIVLIGIFLVVFCSTTTSTSVSSKAWYHQHLISSLITAAQAIAHHSYTYSSSNSTIIFAGIDGEIILSLTAGAASTVPTTWKILKSMSFPVYKCFLFLGQLWCLMAGGSFAVFLISWYMALTQGTFLKAVFSAWAL